MILGANMADKESDTIDLQIAELRKLKSERQWQDYLKNQRPAVKKLVGKCYKYRNSYSQGERWWLYRKILRYVEGDQVDYLIGEKFQTTINGSSNWETDVIISGATVRMGLTEGYIEISEVEYQKARVAFMTEMATLERCAEKLLED
jgi:hypothetical protein